MSVPVVIGDMHGGTVMVDRENRMVILAHPDWPAIKFSIEHPYIQGTKLERDVRSFLSQEEQGGAP